MYVKQHPASGKRGRRILIVVAAGLALAVFVLPAAVLTAFLHTHVDYLGRETVLMPLQGIHTADMYGLEETVHSL